MFCPSCGAENPDDGTFCQKCGVSLKASAPAESVPTNVETGPQQSVVEKVGSYPIHSLLVYGAMAVLVIGLLYGILGAIGIDDAWDSGTLAFAEFLKGLIYGLVGAGVLLGISALIKK